MTQQIVDYTGYNNEMAKSLEDKLFFLKEIPDFNSIFDSLQLQ